MGPEPASLEMQYKLDKFDAEARRVGLKINVQKTKMMRINSSSQELFTIGTQHDRIEDAEEFCYLGATVRKDDGGMKDLKNRFSKAREAFIKLKKIWRSGSVSRKTKLRLYKTLVVPVLVYGCETWKMNKGDCKLIDVFNNRCLRRIMRVLGRPCIHRGTPGQSKLQPIKQRSEEEEVKDDWTHLTVRSTQSHECGYDLGTRREKEERETKNNMAPDCRERMT